MDAKTIMVKWRLKMGYFHSLKDFFDSTVKKSGNHDLNQVIKMVSCTSPDMTPWEGHKDTSLLYVVYLPKIHDLNLTIREHQKTPKWVVYKITGVQEGREGGREEGKEKKFKSRQQKAKKYWGLFQLKDN